MTSATSAMLDEKTAAERGGSASFAGRLDKRAGGPLPQAIAHRGFASEFPENTMEAFRGAVDIGAHAIETDVHLSRDKVVVLSHDGSLVRCFGTKDKIPDCDWSYLSTLRTVRKPNLPMPRLLDLLEYLAQPGLEAVWVLLDIKKCDNPAELIAGMAAALAAAPASRPWAGRVVLGCWDAEHMRLCQEHLPGFAIAFIGVSLPYARQLLRYDGIHFNLLQMMLVGPWGSHFLAHARAKDRNVFVWTVNREEWMEWSIRKNVDGVITDNPRLYLDVCRRHEEAVDDAAAGRQQPGLATAARDKNPAGLWRWTRLYAEIALMQLLATIFITVWRIPFGSERKRVQRALNR